MRGGVCHWDYPAPLHRIGSSPPTLVLIGGDAWPFTFLAHRTGYEGGHTHVIQLTPAVGARI